jgi:CRP-like cAMP-binding protein
VGVLKGQVGLKLARSGRLIDLGAAGFWCGRANPIALTPENLFVEARLPTNMVVLPSTRVRALLEADQRFTAVFSEMMTDSMKKYIDFITKSCEPNSITRVARKIFDLVGVHSDAALYATQNEMAEMLNNSRSTISKSLMMLERKEIIRNGYRYIVVQDGEALLKLAQ